MGALLAVALAVPGIATPAVAEPSAAAIEAQIDRAWNRLEPVIEQHNATRQQLAAGRKRAAQLTSKMAPLELQINIAMSQVGELAAFAYKGGNTSAVNAILLSGSPSRFVDQLQVLDHFARRQQQELRHVVDLKRRYDAQKAPLDVLVAELTRTEQQLAARERQINAEIRKLQELRLRAYGNSGGTGSLRPAPCPRNYPGGAAGKAIKFACAQVGKAYQFGAEGPGAYDCSGLALAAWARAGVSLPHNAAAQRRAVRSVSRAKLREGDLVFYYGDLHHVGLYAGGGWIVHASQPGEPVHMDRIDHAPVHSYGRPG